MGFKNIEGPVGKGRDKKRRKENLDILKTRDRLKHHSVPELGDWQ